MSIRLEIQSVSGLLNVRATGRFSLEEAKRTFIQMLEAMALHKTRKTLVDGRKLVGRPRTMERFYYGEFAAETVANFPGVPPASQFAYVLKEPVLDPRRFGETVAVNRGMNVKTFHDPEEALRWLGIAPSNNSEADHSK